MMAKDMWGVVWEVAMCILRAFGILIVVCNHGRHRSLSLAYELADRLGCELVSQRYRHCPTRLCTPDQLLAHLTPRLVWHRKEFGGCPYPIA